MSDRTDQQAAMDSLGAPAGRHVVERVTAERLARPPRLRAVDARDAATTDRAAELESQLLEERAARRSAEAAANEMAVLVARVREELAEERQARASAEQTAAETAELIAREHARSRKAQEDLRLAWAQVPVLDQRDVSLEKPPLGRRWKRAAGR